jgi:hypothetical protein
MQLITEEFFDVNDGFGNTAKIQGGQDCDDPNHAEQLYERHPTLSLVMFSHASDLTGVGGKRHAVKGPGRRGAGRKDARVKDWSLER